ncbi:hypothetical protein FRZ06_10410 [Anoxybacterium hadale]|uniref:Uncharacterized protein n=1 Tax=Anoxybacterium hadale TaxID=3408580 RepID=A0ACD1AB59_9FIRM|nr:hypothetical protein FRZ06_10410 [Clostridiales bacterium]
MGISIRNTKGIAAASEINAKGCKEEPIRVLILSDRLLKQAQHLAEYLINLDGFEVVGIALEKDQILELAGEAEFDFLIIVGYLKTFPTYEVIEELQKQKKEFQTVQWAILDSLILELCKRYKIPLTFERTLPMEAFADFLWERRSGKKKMDVEEQVFKCNKGAKYQASSAVKEDSLSYMLDLFLPVSFD